LADKEQFETKKKKADAWLTYADGSDAPFTSYKTKFSAENVAPMCEHTAPASFKYDSPAADVLPTKTVALKSGIMLQVPQKVRLTCTLPAYCSA